jgi:predicted ester cyclase
MSTDENKAVVRRFFEEAWNQGNLSVADETYSVDNIHHFGGAPGPLGPDQAREQIKAWRTAIPDYRFHIEDMVAEGDMVVTRLHFTGTHTSAGLKIAGRTATPQNKTFEEAEMVMTRIKDGKIVESWATWDRLSFLEQLGAIPRATSAV